jgi:hypothetical protein
VIEIGTEKGTKNENDCENGNEIEKRNAKRSAWSGVKRRGSVIANVHLKLSLNELQCDPPRTPVVLQRILAGRL